MDTKDRKGKKVAHRQLSIWEESMNNINSINRDNPRRKSELNIATHNINGIKSNIQKIDSLYEWAIDNSIDILGVAETNISSKEGMWITREHTKFRSFWSSSNKDKKKGSGVGLLISDQWEKYIGQIDKVNEYLISVSLVLKQLEIIIIMLYIPPNNEYEKKIVQKKIIEKFINRSLRSQVVVIGDFNSIIDPELDRSPILRQIKQDPLLNWLQKQEFLDAFRTIYPRTKRFTWTNGDTSTRIDQIWVSEELAQGLFDAEIQEMDVYTNSDHEAMIARIDLKHLSASQSAAACKRSKQTRTVFLCDKASEENWENYRKQIDSLLKKSTSIAKMLRKTQQQREESPELDELWDDISKAILAAARCNLPKKKVCNTVQNKKKNAKESRLSYSIMQLGRWINIGRKNIKLGLISENILDLVTEIEYINQQHKTNINKAITTWSYDLIDDLKGW